MKPRWLWNLATVVILAGMALLGWVAVFGPISWDF